MVELVLRGGTVVDGTGAPGRRGDVAIDGGRVVAIGAVDDEAATTVDVDGLVVAPGFIDLHTHYDAQLFWDPYLSPSPLHGVTTVVAGNCGLTLAPAAPADREFLCRLLARVESIPTEALLAGVDYRWRSYPEFLSAVQELAPAVNVGFMVGHCALRRAAMGEAASERAATDDEVGAMVALLHEGLAAGGLGLSTSSAAAQVDGEGRPTPPSFASREELLALAGACRGHAGTSLEFIPDSFARGFTPDDVALLSDMSVAADRHLNWNTPLINRDDPDLHWRQLAATDQAAARSGRVVALFMPQNGPLQHDFLRAYVFRGLPGWGEVLDQEPAARLAALADPAVRRHLYESAEAATSGLTLLVRNWGAYEVNEVGGTRDPALSGRKVSDIAAQRGVSDFDAMLDIVVDAKLDVGFVRYQYPTDEWTQAARRDVLRDPRVVLGASDGGAHLDMMVGADFPTRSLAQLVRDEGVFTT
jgi:N-acyl-D-aspartate/D-glutamate deacylase